MPASPLGEALFRCARPSGVPRGPDNSTGSVTSQSTLGSSLRSPAEGEGNEGFLPPPEKDLESPSSTRLEALVTSRDSAMTRSPSPRAWHWKVKSSPLKHQRNPQIYFKIETLYHYNDVIGLMLFLYMLKVKIALLQYKMCTYVPDKLTICTTTGRTSGKHWSLPTAFLKT